MELRLERIGQRVGAATHLYPIDLALAPRAVTVLLGATQAGKTTLMRVMAGLDVPTVGRVLADEKGRTAPIKERAQVDPAARRVGKPLSRDGTVALPGVHRSEEAGRGLVERPQSQHLAGPDRGQGQETAGGWFRPGRARLEVAAADLASFRNGPYVDVAELVGHEGAVVGTESDAHELP